MIDLHTHILPGIDDGPPDLDGSLALARAAVDGGTSTMVGTPHVDHRFGVVIADIPARAAALQQELEARDIPLAVVAGAEVAATRAFDLTDDELAGVAIGSGRWILLECPLVPETILESAAQHLRGRGYEVILAHPERSPGIRREPDRLGALVDFGCLSSITDGSLRGRFGRDPQEAALHFLDQGLVHNVTSDAHSATSRGPGLHGGLEEAEAELPGVAQLQAWLTHEVPTAIVAGSPVPPRPPVPVGPLRPKRHRWLRRR